MKILKNKAFTLAEVLITLGIIGVVAAMTIPTLMTKYQKHVALTRLKKTYSQLNQVFKLLNEEQGLEVMEGLPRNTVPTYILPYYAGAKYYPPNSNHRLAMCYSPNHYYLGAKSNNAQYSTLPVSGRKGACGGYISTPFMSSHTASIELVDGTCIGFNYFASEGISIFVDINGSANPPNCLGKDLFFLKVDSNSSAVLPVEKWGIFDQTKFGAYKIINDGWRFAKDYPW